MLVAREAKLAAVEAHLAYWYAHDPFTDAVARRRAYSRIHCYPVRCGGRPP